MYPPTPNPPYPVPGQGAVHGPVPRFDPTLEGWAGQWAGTAVLGPTDGDGEGCEPAARRPLRLGDPGLVQAALSAGLPEAERSRALQLLGLSPRTDVRAVAVVVCEPGLLQRALDGCAERLGGRESAPTTAHAAVLWPTVGAVLLPGSAAVPRQAEPGPAHTAMGVGPATGPQQLPDSWAQARRAARFAGLGPTWPRAVVAEDLGALALLADFPASTALAHPDVGAVARLGCGPDGEQALATLEAVCRSSSLREAAKILCLHHSAVAHRIRRIERILRVSLSDAHGRQRVQTALLLWQLNAPGNWRDERGSSQHGGPHSF
ncbi:helix-turn-helix domain-containing protein [Streptomyces sp. NPDC055897]